ncbi:MAG TPA: hypothetical protein VNW72_06440 [Chthoniobacterales bacterium]|nr:hypothetical protein [Chthoniobacterales bacterium]
MPKTGMLSQIHLSKDSAIMTTSAKKPDNNLSTTLPEQSLDWPNQLRT